MDDLTLDDSYDDRYLEGIYNTSYDISGCQRILLVGIPNPKILYPLFQQLADRDFGILDCKAPPSDLPENVTYHQGMFETTVVPEYDIALLYGVYSWISKEAVEGLKKNVFSKISKRIYFEFINSYSMAFSHRKAFEMVREQVPDIHKAAAITKRILETYNSDLCYPIDDEFIAHHFFQPHLHGYALSDIITEYKELGWEFVPEEGHDIESSLCQSSIPVRFERS